MIYFCGLFIMIVCLGVCSCKSLKDRIYALIHGFHFRVIFVSHFSQGFDVMVNFVIYGFHFKAKMVKVRFR